MVGSLWFWSKKLGLSGSAKHVLLSDLVMSLKVCGIVANLVVSIIWEAYKNKCFWGQRDSSGVKVLILYVSDTG